MARRSLWDIRNRRVRVVVSWVVVPLIVLVWLLALLLAIVEALIYALPGYFREVRYSLAGVDKSLEWASAWRLMTGKERRDPEDINGGRG